MYMYVCMYSLALALAHTVGTGNMLVPATVTSYSNCHTTRVHVTIYCLQHFYLESLILCTGGDTTLITWLPILKKEVCISAYTCHFNLQESL